MTAAGTNSCPVRGGAGVKQGGGQRAHLQPRQYAVLVEAVPAGQLHDGAALAKLVVAHGARVAGAACGGLAAVAARRCAISSFQTRPGSDPVRGATRRRGSVATTSGLVAYMAGWWASISCVTKWSMFAALPRSIGIPLAQPADTPPRHADLTAVHSV